MGYCITQSCSEFFIPKENIPDLIKAIRSLSGKDYEDQRRGGSYISGGTKNQSWFSWVDMSFVNSNDIQDIFDCWRWNVELDDEGNIDVILFRGEKSGEDKLLFDTIAPFVKTGSFIEMTGEDGYCWRWLFKDSKCTEITPKWDM